MNKYGLMVAANNSPYLLETVDEELPPNPKRYSLAKAKQLLDKWISYADTIGGYGKVIDLDSGKVVYC